MLGGPVGEVGQKCKKNFLKFYYLNPEVRGNQQTFRLIFTTYLTKGVKTLDTRSF